MPIENANLGFQRRQKKEKLLFFKISEVNSLSRVRLFVTPWTVAYQAPPPMGFSRQEYWSGLPFPSPGIFPTQGSNPGLLHCRQMLLMTNLDSILKSRDMTLPTVVRLVKAMVFPVVMYGFEIWTIKIAEHQRIDAFELWCWRRLLRVSWTARRSNRSILKEISPEYSLEGLMLKLNSNTLAPDAKS